ncbi:MAG: PEP-CTERM sorting domain-containing protein [Verrucomicrobiota bacterium]
MNRIVSASWFALLSLLHTARADLDIAVDMDPSTPGIQSNLMVSVGGNFDIDVYFISDTTEAFTSVGMSLEYNQTATNIVRTPFNQFDPSGAGLADIVLAGSPVFHNSNQANPLTAGEGMVSLLLAPGAAGFLSSDGGLYIHRILGMIPFYQGGMPADGTPVLIQRANFTAEEAGVTEIRPNGILLGNPVPGGPFGPDTLFFDNNGVPVLSSVQPGFVTVTAAIPEPGTLASMLAGLLMVAFLRSRRTES